MSVDSEAPAQWAPGSWKSFPALQQPAYPDSAALDSVLAELSQLPPLVTSWEVAALRSHFERCGARAAVEAAIDELTAEALHHLDEAEMPAVVKAALGETTLELELDKLLGKPWDDELETFRYAGDGAPVRWLHQVV